MSVIRIQHNKNYVIINKTALEDHRLSFKAKGLFAYCMSRPDDWKFHVSHLATVSKDGVDSIYSALKELIEFGYCERVQKNPGKFGSVEYILYESPDFKKCLPQRDFPDADSPHAEDPALLSIDINQGKKEQQQEGQSDVVVSFEDPDRISGNLKNGGLVNSQISKALLWWSKYKNNLMKKNPDNPLGYLIWMVKKNINPFQVDEDKVEKCEKRKKWAYKNEYVTNAGGCTATPSGYEVISGSIAKFYRYDENSEFWNLKGL